MASRDLPGPAAPSPGRTVIGLLEDDPLIAEVIEGTLEGAGWDYHLFTSVAEISTALRTQSFDLLLLDWTLPDGEADSVIRLVRQQLRLATPILIESASGDENQIVEALALGADDYVVKPLRLSEVQARIAALLRRVRHDAPGPLQLGPYRVDATNKLVYRLDQPVDLTLMEYDLARFFLEHPDELLSRERILSEVWNCNPEIDTRTVDMHVSRLRRKLQFGAGSGLQISTLRGYGYRLEADGE